MKIIITFLFFFLGVAALSQPNKPLRIGVAGLTHDHAKGLMNRASTGGIELVGVAEPNRALYDRYMKRYNLSIPWFASLAEMLDKTKPEAVVAFNSIEEHMQVVKECAPRGIHVMVEKPLAVSVDHSVQMAALARKHKIQLLTNYETTWYRSQDELQKKLPQLGDIRKIVVHDGHNGPREIGCSEEFLAWLTDPVKNGGGAVIDFGCYGANLSTWLMKGARPATVSAILQTLKPDVYPKVDDEATIVLTYPHAQTIIQASWNWLFGIKDLWVYGKDGYAVADSKSLRFRLPQMKTEETLATEKILNDPFTYLASVVSGEIKVDPRDLSALENNLIVVEILEAAKLSARTGKVVKLN